MVDSLTITFLSGLKKGQSISFNLDEEITIGRGQSNHIVFDGPDDKSVSRQHAIIKNKTPGQDGEWIFKDQSTNGTYLNGTKLLNQSFDLNDGDVLAFTKDKQDIRIKIKTQDQNVVEEKINKDETSASFTKIVPTANPGFLKEVTDQPFFLPAICTVLAAVFLFWALRINFTVYTTGLGIYLALMMLFFVRTISGMKVPFWLLGGTSLASIVLFYIEVPWILLRMIFRPPFITMFMESNIFLQQFIGHFIGAGLMEELFKVIPVFVFVIFKNKFNHLHLSGLSNGKVSPVLTMLIGVSSAVGFIFHETIFDYVPRFAAEQGEIIGLALLIPRFISGIAGHVGFTGIFSYYIGLAFYYKNFNPMLLIIGWVLPSLLHGLWNASPNLIISSSIAIATFTIFMIYIIKAKKSFPT
jgi:RsiW-degrading membrane proteinase PrsW (M82 family)